MRTIFICLTKALKKRHTLKERLHLVKGQNIEYSEINWHGNTFYAAKVTAYHKKYFEKFTSRARYPIIAPDDIRIKKLQYTVTANTVFKIFDKTNINIALFDTDCRIIHLLPRLLAKSRSVYVYTKCTDTYERENSRIFSLIGAAAVISDRPVLPRGINAVISAENMQFGDIPVFGEYGYFANNTCPVFNDSQMLTLPNYCDIYACLAGLLEIGKIKNIADAFCYELQFNNISVDIKNLP